MGALPTEEERAQQELQEPQQQEQQRRGSGSRTPSSGSQPRPPVSAPLGRRTTNSPSREIDIPDGLSTPALDEHAHAVMNALVNSTGACATDLEGRIRVDAERRGVHVGRGCREYIIFKLGWLRTFEVTGRAEMERHVREAWAEGDGPPGYVCVDPQRPWDRVRL